MIQEIKDLSDKDLLQQCNEGDNTAFNELFRRYFNKLYQYTLSFTKDALVAEELVMDVMLNLWLRKGDITLTDSLGPYLFRAMKNTLINYWRKKIIPTTSLKVTEEIDFADSRSADHSILTTELDNLYSQHLQALSPQRKKVFELSRHEDLTYPEIASQLNLSVKTVEHHMSASLVFLRKKLKPLSDTTVIILFLLSQ
ncbi:MAG: RNA polymerase sigma-70 factor [Chitinophaga sp.]|uniref:RNA polymerase sigma-70 factor n=1 Tax=Chitinophaga sp. TaxID=1869181 RepID=UPI001B14A484|nr:RNA polymerase sigma-70 factor [Chitinophaga sp.]MBO9728559.1 RNA polymerase sigma-70 factor [Chitinophaga sp.]